MSFIFLVVFAWGQKNANTTTNSYTWRDNTCPCNDDIFNWKVIYECWYLYFINCYWQLNILTNLTIKWGKYLENRLELVSNWKLSSPKFELLPIPSKQNSYIQIKGESIQSKMDQIVASWISRQNLSHEYCHELKSRENK